LNLVLGEFEMRQIGDVEHSFASDFHGKRTSVANFPRASRKRPQPFLRKKRTPARRLPDGAASI
jgi:hypothetical protein